MTDLWWDLDDKICPLTDPLLHYLVLRISVFMLCVIEKFVSIHIFGSLLITSNRFFSNFLGWKYGYTPSSTTMPYIFCSTIVSPQFLPLIISLYPLQSTFLSILFILYLFLFSLWLQYLPCYKTDHFIVPNTSPIFFVPFSSLLGFFKGSLMSLWWLRERFFNYIYLCQMVLPKPIFTCCTMHFPNPCLLFLDRSWYHVLWKYLSVLLHLGISYNCWSLLSITVRILILLCEFNQAIVPWIMY